MKVVVAPHMIPMNTEMKCVEEVSELEISLIAECAASDSPKTSPINFANITVKDLIIP